MDIIIKFTILIRIICDKKVYISICNFFLDNGYTYVVKNGFGDYCGDLIEKECAVKASEYMLDKNINEFLEETDKQSNRNYYIWNWGKYHIQNDTIVVKWFYNHFGDYFLVEKKNALGQHMRPQPRNSGLQLRTNFNRTQRFEAMKQFYDKNWIKYWDARWDFYKNNNLNLILWWQK